MSKVFVDAFPKLVRPDLGYPQNGSCDTKLHKHSSLLLPTSSPAVTSSMSDALCWDKCSPLGLLPGESEGLFILSRLERGTGRRWVGRIPASGHCFNKRQDFPLRKAVPEGCTDCHLLATWAGVSVQRRGSTMLMARFLQASTASISLLEEGGPASPSAVILPEDCNVPARNNPLSTQAQ